MVLDFSRDLSLKNPAYLKAVHQFVWEAYLSDVGKGDITTDLFLGPAKSTIVRARIVAKEAGIFAGLLEADWFLKKLGIRITQKLKEGAPFRKGTALLTLQGRADRILAAERTLLNLLQRMSGIATATHRLASQLPKNIALFATRKTFWGLLDKRAVTVGGGGTHRLNLSDAVLVKDNHWALLSSREKTKVLNEILKKFQDDSMKKARFIEIELDRMSDVRHFARFYPSLPAKLKQKRPMVVMIDNFKPSLVRKAVQILKPCKVMIEVSGGINAKNIHRYAIPGVHAISSGSITNKAPAIDLSLEIKL